MKLTFNNKKLELLSHIFIWVGYSLLVFSGPILSQDFTVFSLQITIRALIVNSILFYLNTFVLLPGMVGKSHYLLYILTVVTLLGISTMTYQITDDWMRRPNGNFRIEQMDGPEKMGEIGKMDDRFMNDEFRPDNLPRNGKFDFERKGPPMLFGFMSSLGILFISTIFWVITEAKRRQQRELSLINENLTTEMKFLKSQINPHFLFNALNNIYSLSHLNSKKTPDMILKLSDMLRFMLYDSEDRKVPIGKEIDYINHFIDFQKLKIEGEPRVSVLIENTDRTVMIEPMLLIPFIENAFKHSKIEDLRNGWLKIALSATQREIKFEVSNSLPASTIQVDKVGGIGLENVKKRLQYLYPQKHNLAITTGDKTFTIYLTIDLTIDPKKQPN
jgi:two-component system LytT family sensor kinase